MTLNRAFVWTRWATALVLFCVLAACSTQNQPSPTAGAPAPTVTHETPPDTPTLTPEPTAAQPAFTPLNATNLDQIRLINRWGRGKVNDLALSDNGQWIAVGTTLGIWVLDTSDIAAEPFFQAVPGGAARVALSPKGKLAASADPDGLVQMYSLPGLTPMEQYYDDQPAEPIGLQFVDHGRAIALSTLNGVCLVWNLANETLRDSLWIDMPSEVVLSPDGALVAAGMYDNFIQIWTAGTGKHSGTLGHTDGIFSMDYSPDGQYLAAGVDTDEAWIYAMEDGKVAAQLGHNGARVSALDFSADSARLLTADEAGTLRIWSVPGGELEAQISAGRQPVQWAAFTPEGDAAWFFTEDGRISKWQPKDGTIDTARDDFAAFSVVSISRDNQLAATGGADGLIRLWGFPGGEPPRVLGEIPGGVSALTFSPSGEALNAGGADRQVKQISTQTGLVEWSSGALEDRVNCVFDLNNSEYLFASTFNGPLQRWQHSDKSRTQLDLESMVLACSPADDGSLAVSLFDGRVIVIGSDFTQKQELQTFGSQVTQLALSRDGEWLAGGGLGTDITIWQVNPPHQKRLFTGQHQDGITGLAYSSSGEVLVSASWDQTVKFWDVNSGEIVTTLTFDSAPRGLAISQDDHFMLVVLDDGTISVFRLMAEE